VDFPVNRGTQASSVWAVTAGSQVGNRLVAKTASVVRKSSTAAATRPIWKCGAMRGATSPARDPHVGRAHDSSGIAKASMNAAVNRPSSHA
jgi:hypothetical protein